MIGRDGLVAKSLGHFRGRKHCDPHQALIMKGVLAACVLTASFLAGAAAAPVTTQSPLSDAQLAEVLVVGKQPGPGLWRISKGDHDLWIFATLTPLPKQMIWDATDIGDVARLQPLLPADEPIACFDAVMSVSRFRSEYDQVSARLDALWISSAEQALQRNRSTLAVVGIKKLLAADGWLAQLRSRGYEIREP
jgi:hypothetical protein